MEVFDLASAFCISYNRQRNRTQFLCSVFAGGKQSVPVTSGKSIMLFCCWMFCTLGLLHVLNQVCDLCRWKYFLSDINANIQTLPFAGKN